MKKLINLRKNRVRARISGTPERPRLAVFISHSHIHAQIIDDTTSKTLASASTVGKELKGSKTELAAIVGKDIAVAAKKAKIKKVVFDRGDRHYGKRLGALADAARKEGLEF